MKLIYLLLLTVGLSCRTCYAQSLQDPKNLVSDLQSILKENSSLKVRSGNQTWTEELGSRGPSKDIFSGSAYIVFDDATGTTAADLRLAERVCNGFRELYHLGGTRGGSSGHVSPKQLPQSGEAYLEWVDDRDVPPRKAEKISLRVQVLALREAQIGFVLTFVHVPPANTPAP